MESVSSRSEQDLPSMLTLPSRALVALCGPAGSGKSTLAQRLIKTYQRKGLSSTMIVSSDYCRALVCDDETNQRVNRDTFDLFHYIIHKRMFQGRFTIADSTALQPEARLRLLSLAQRHQYYTCLLVFNVPPLVCLQRDRKRRRMVGEQVIAFHTERLLKTLQEAPEEGWNKIHILGEQDREITLEFSSAI